jgi:predicted Zn-dependent protease
VPQCFSPRSTCVALCFVFALAVHGHGDLDLQIQAVSRDIEKETNNAALYLKRGELYHAHRDWDLAAADFDRVAKLDKSITSVDFYRGRMLLEAERYQLAREALDRFLSKQPDNAEGLVTRGRTLAKLNQCKAAATDFTRAIGLAQTLKPEYFIERAQALVQAGAPAEALRGLDEGIQKMGRLVTLELLALDIERQQKAYDAALKRIDQVSAQFQRKETWLVRRAEILREAGRKAEEREAWQAALAAIEKLPDRLRGTRATIDLEKKIRDALAAISPASAQRK